MEAIYSEGASVEEYIRNRCWFLFLCKTSLKKDEERIEVPSYSDGKGWQSSSTKGKSPEVP